LHGLAGLRIRAFHPLSSRIQLSLFVPEAVSAKLEAVRRVLDPVQSSLIPAHVTLCREDELASLSLAELRSRLLQDEVASITLRFGRPEVFDGHGILLPCVGGEPEFLALRQHLLGSRQVRHHAPHITLAHPRNPKAPGNHLANAADLADPLTMTFSSIRRIEQQGSAPWQVLEEFLPPGS
jgi:2'-5' RNA ligase